MRTSLSVKESAIRFLQWAGSGQVDQAFELVAPHFRHHNPYFLSGAAALKAGMRENATQHPNKIFEVQRVIAEGPLVAVHSRVQMATNATTISVVHLFRFENGLIAELWDVGQPQPEDVVNEAGMF